MEFKGVSYFPHHGPITYSCNENNDDRPFTVEPQYNEGPREKSFVKPRTSLYRGLLLSSLHCTPQ